MPLLSETNAHPFDQRIRFQEEGHIYWIDNDCTDLVSSTSFIHQFFSDFDSDKIISRIVNSARYTTDAEYEYYGMQPAAIKKKWSDNASDAANAGTKLHADIESFYNGLPVTNTSVEYAHFLQFQQDHPNLQIYRTEWLIFSEALCLTGSIDAVFRDPEDNQLILGDWKRSKEIRYVPYDSKKGKFPFEHLPDTNFYHYSLQLNLYRIILETFYGEQVKQMFLVVCHPSNNSYIKLDVERMEKEGEWLLDARKQQLISKGYEKERFDAFELSWTLDKKRNDIVAPSRRQRLLK